MELVNYKSLPIVPTSKNLIDFSLSKTQRKTPSEIHKNYDISRIRNFYMRKVKFSQQTFHDKLSAILENFPKIDNMHPFYADLINVLYDRDHYKIALGKLNIAKGLVDKIAREYVRLLKYGDSLYRCKTLKRIALGRMVTLVKKCEKSLVYLEQVRQHMSRLPTIDPATRTILLCGFPNVGKSSFINSVTRADVEVQPYPFTTKSLYVGQTDYKYLRFQVIDTPGILDQPLEDRNTIEMQAVTALAHLRAAIIFMLDVSETCGYSIEEQVALFNHLTPLFTSKVVIIGLNKIDIAPLSNLSEEQKSLLSSLESKEYILTPLSTLTSEGVMGLRDQACDLLLAQRESSMTSSKKMDKLSNRLHVAVPKIRDSVHRPPSIPHQLLADVSCNKDTTKHPTQKELKIQQDDNYVFDERLQYLLKENEKYDVIPEIMDGKNISDFIDPNIALKLRILEEEETLRENSGFYNIEKWSDMELKAYLDREGINELRKVAMSEHALKKNSSRTNLPKIITSKVEKFNKSGKKKSFLDDFEELENEDDESSMDEYEAGPFSKSYQLKLKESGITNEARVKCTKLIRKGRARNNKLARAGESDRRILNLKPKHLFSGKRKAGKTQRR